MTGVVDDVGLHARVTPNALAAHDLAPDRRYTYAELDCLIARFAAQLLAMDIRSGNRIALLARNCIACVALHLACARIGAIYVPLNWRLAANEIAGLISDAEPSLLLGDGCLGAIGLDGLSTDSFAKQANQQTPHVAQRIDPDRPSLILYTSGTSGRPKGAVLSEHNLEATAINFAVLGNVDSRSVFLIDAPMFHVLGLITTVRPPLRQGGVILVSDGFVPARTLARLGDPDLAVTHYFCVPQMAARLRAEPGFDPKRLARLIALFTGGAPHPAADIRAWLVDGVPVVDGFGMSECGTVFGMPLDPERIAIRAGSVGVAPPGVHTRIVDAQERDCALGVSGELLVRGDNVFSGYWRAPEASHAAFTEDGWFRTGDIARRDADGYYWIIDRAKDMFISGGENVYPAEIEAILAGHPDLAECAVVGVSDPQWGEVGHLFLVAAPGRTADPDAIRRIITERLARYKVPKHISLIAALPRNGAGKVLKKELQRGG